MKGRETILGGCCTQCMVYSVYACARFMLLLGVCLYSVNAGTRCMLVLSVCLYLVLATGPISHVGSGYGSTRNWTVATGLTTRKTWTVGNGPVLPPKTRHFKSIILAPIQYLSSDRIMTWSVRTLCSFSRSFTSCCQICDRTNIRCVAIENPPILRKITRYFATIQRILVRSQIWRREVKERLEMHNLRTDHVMIRSELKYLIWAKGGGTVQVEPRPG